MTLDLKQPIFYSLYRILQLQHWEFSFYSFDDLSKSQHIYSWKAFWHHRRRYSFRCADWGYNTVWNNILNILRFWRERLSRLWYDKANINDFETWNFIQPRARWSLLGGQDITGRQIFPVVNFAGTFNIFQCYFTFNIFQCYFTNSRGACFAYFMLLPFGSALRHWAISSLLSRIKPWPKRSFEEFFASLAPKKNLTQYASWRPTVRSSHPEEFC